MQPWEYVIYDVKMSNVKFMRANIRADIGIRNLFIWYIRGIRDICIGYILSEKRACKSCNCVLVRSIRIIFGQVRVRYESATVITIVNVYPLILVRAVE